MSELDVVRASVEATASACAEVLGELVGATGSFEGTTLTVIGFLVRSVTWEGERFAWSEYLLYQPRLGFRWLVEGDGHWSYVRPVAAAEPITVPTTSALRSR